MLHKIQWSILFPHHVQTLSSNRHSIYSFVLEQPVPIWLLRLQFLWFASYLTDCVKFFFPEYFPFSHLKFVTSNVLSSSLLYLPNNIIHFYVFEYIIILCQLSALYHLWTVYLKNLLHYIYLYNFLYRLYKLIYTYITFYYYPFYFPNLILLAASILIKGTTTHTFNCSWNNLERFLLFLNSHYQVNKQVL